MFTIVPAFPFQLAETTADLAEEHAAATAVSERLQFESAERQRLEKELLETQTVKCRLAETNEQLEMQLLCMRSTDPSLMSSSSSVAGTVSDDDSAVAHSDKAGDQYYRRRYERVCRELEYAKKRLQQQHNDDMEQLLAMKKQLEKKVSQTRRSIKLFLLFVPPTLQWFVLICIISLAFVAIGEPKIFSRR